MCVPSAAAIPRGPARLRARRRRRLRPPSLQADELVDFVVPRTAAVRFLAHEPLYRPDDGHYQYKYLPAFALAMVPFTWVPKEVAQFTWFTLTVAMTWAFVRLSHRRAARSATVSAAAVLAHAAPERQVSRQGAGVRTVQPAGGAAPARRGDRRAARPGTRGGRCGRAPACSSSRTPSSWCRGWPGRSGGAPSSRSAWCWSVGLVLPAAFYGWNGNLTLLYEWYRTVTDTTGPNLLASENISFASMWAKWIGAGPDRRGASRSPRRSLLSPQGSRSCGDGDSVAEPNYLGGRVLLLLVPLLSPQGWDYVLMIGTARLRVPRRSVARAVAQLARRAR